MGKIMTLKSLLLGTAAAFAVVSGAQAADAIVAAAPEPMDYVKVCDAFGTGYFYIPGTETCLRISGRVRADYQYAESLTRTGNTTGFRARGIMNLDAFVTKGWEATSEVGAVAGKESAGLTAKYNGGMAIYQIGETGLLLDASISGSKYWVDKDLTEKSR